MNCRNGTSHFVRPHQEVFMNEQEESSMGEGREIKRKMNIVEPGKEEYEQHRSTHIPFRKWCPSCCTGNIKAPPIIRKERKKRSMRYQQLVETTWNKRRTMESLKSQT